MSYYLGHSRNGNGNGKQELLKDHLNAVANSASKFMSFWGHGFSGWVGGLFHDLGKYADQMQLRLKNPSQVSGKNHAAAGACWIAYHYKNSLPLALAVLYHHGGLKRFFYSRTELLKELGTNINQQDDEGETALMYRSGENINIIKWLLELGADKTLKDKEGKTAYDRVKQRKTVDNDIKQLLKP